MSKTAFIKSKVIWSAEVDHITWNFFKGCLPQILLGPFLNILPYILWYNPTWSRKLSLREPFTFTQSPPLIHNDYINLTNLFSIPYFLKSFQLRAAFHTETSNLILHRKSNLKSNDWFLYETYSLKLKLIK